MSHGDPGNLCPEGEDWSPKMPMPPTRQSTEVVADPGKDRVQRRRFTGEYKQKILEEADKATGHGEVTALLRREGLYSSHLSKWRQQVRQHGSAGLEPKARGPKPKRNEQQRQIDKLQRDKAKLERELLIARKLLDLAGKAHEILGVALPSLDNDEAL
jgi:transposase-like protein